MLTSLILAALLQVSAPPQDEVVVTGSRIAETASDVRVREAIAYEQPLPRGAPEEDYALVAWCDALVSGHVRLGETLTDRDPLDLEIMRLGRLEAADFRSALAESAPRQSAATRADATAAAASAAAMWTPLMSQPDEKLRSQSFGLFFGLPGRCEHAARRIRANITIPPVSLSDAGLDDEGRPKAP